MRKPIFLTMVLLAAMTGWSMNAEAKKKHRGHAPVAHHYHHYHHGHHPKHGYRSHRPYRQRHYYTTHYHTRYYVPQRRVYVYGPPPPGVAFEYYRPDRGLWISIGF